MKSHRELPSPRLRVLALHGRGSNSEITRMQLLNLGISEAEYDIVYLDGPLREDAPGPGIAELAGLVAGPWHSWIRYVDDEQADGNRIDADSLLMAVLHVLDAVDEQGPFDAVYCFSQACIVAGLVNGLGTDEALQVALGRYTGKSQAAAGGGRVPFPAAIFACAAAPVSLPDLRAQAGLGSPPMAYPGFHSLHLIGMQDEYKPWSEAFALSMNSTATEVLYLAGGHDISQLQRADSTVGDAIRACLLRARNVRPEALEGLPRPLWRLSSERSSRAVDRDRQVVAVHARTGDLPDTILGMLAARPVDAPLFRVARERDPDVCTTYGQMLAFCRPGGEGDLRRIGVEAGEVVAYLAPPGGSATAAAAFLSIASQAIAAPFSPSMTENDALAALSQYGARHMILFDGVLAPGVRAAFESHAAAGKARLHRASEVGPLSPGLFRYQTPDAPLQPRDALLTAPTATCLLLRTSGTTSLPKLVPLRQGDLVLNAALLADGLGISASDVTYSVMPLDHIGGLSASILCSVAVGASITCDGAYTPQGMVEALADSNPRPTWYSAVPTIHNATARHLRDNAYVDADGVWHGHRLRFIRSGAAALKEPDRDTLETTYGCEVVTTYSMSELMPISQPPRDGGSWQQGAGTVGVPVVASMAVIDPASLRPLPYGSEGEIAISGPTVFPGYLNNPDANRGSRFLLRSHDDGLLHTWFLTGDLGELDGEGALALKGRLKELIKRGGEQVSPVEVEAALVKHPWVDMAVCFSVPSDVYGEEVGCALVLNTSGAGRQSEREIVRELRNFLRQSGLAPYKIPAYIKLVSDDALPKTASRKYIRKGLAEVLGVVASTGNPAPSASSPAGGQTASPARPAADKPKVDWSTLAGFRFVLACYVMFMHIGSDVSWDAVSNLRQFPWHVHSFFAVAGFSLVAFMPSMIQRKGAFIWARISGMYPLYALALLLALINLFPSCQPSSFSPIFHWSAQPGDAARMFCEGTPLIQDSWIGNLLSTIAIYVTGLSATPLWSAAWFMGFYLWFISMYFQCLIVFPFLYNALLRNRGRTRRLLLLTVLGLVANVVVVLAFWYGYAVDATGFGFFDQLTGEKITPTAAQVDMANRDNAVILGFYLFAPFWMIYFVAGMCAAFLYDAVRPAEQPTARRWGHVADSITVVMLLVSIAHVAQGYFPHGADISRVSLEPFFMRPDAADTFADPAAVNRIWDNIYARLFAPITLLWIFSLSTGQGVTASLLRARPISQTLAPAAYGCFLFHQMVGQWYYAITRHGEWWNWWSYRKAFYWFSPQPVPVEWYEYFYVVGLVVLFAKAVQPIEPVLKRGFARVGGFLMGGAASGQAVAQDTLSRVLGIVERETGMEAKPEWHLEECGLASLGVVRFTAALQDAFSTEGKRIVLAAAQIMAARDIREIAAIIESAPFEGQEGAPVLQPT